MPELRVQNIHAPEGLLLGRPAADSGVGTASWVLYESGDIVLRRSRHEADVVSAAAFHLHYLQHAIGTSLLPLRVRTVLLANGSAVLVAPGPVHDVAGHDRRLGGRGVTMLPTTVAVVDVETCEVVLPPQSIDAAVPAGRRPISSLLLSDQHEPNLDGADLVLAIARTLIRDPDRDLQHSLDQIAVLAEAGVASMAEGEEITRTIGALGASSGS